MCVYMCQVEIQPTLKGEGAVRVSALRGTRAHAEPRTDSRFRSAETCLSHCVLDVIDILRLYQAVQDKHPRLSFCSNKILVGVEPIPTISSSGKSLLCERMREWFGKKTKPLDILY